MEKRMNDNNGVNNSNVVMVEDATTTKGKVSAKFTLVDEAQKEQEAEKVDKNRLFSIELSEYFCPIKFDAEPLETALSPLVLSGIMSTDAKAAAIEKAKKEFLESHSDEIENANKLSFAEVVARLKENETLYKKVLTACKVSELKESEYICDGCVMIYRANQCKDKEGNERYDDATLSTVENGKKFSVSLYVEYREITTANVLLAIRYHQSKLDATKRLLNQISDYKRILTYVFEAAKKAKENGFSMEQVTEQVTKVFSHPI